MFSKIGIAQLSHTKSFSFPGSSKLFCPPSAQRCYQSSRGTVVPAFRPSGGSRPIRASHRGQPFSHWLNLIEGIQLCLRRKPSEKGKVSSQVALGSFVDVYQMSAGIIFSFSNQIRIPNNIIFSIFQPV